MNPVKGKARYGVFAALALACACVMAATMLGGCGSKEPSVKSTDAVQVTQENREAALSFAEAWYGDWTFEDSEMRLVSSTPVDRCNKYVEPGTPLAQEMKDLSSSRDSARCVMMVNTPSAEGDSVIIEVEYVSTQKTGIDEAIYKELQKNPATDKLIMNFNADGRIIHISGLS